ncbi:MAG: NusG domain II-containing protein [Ignavibacteriales bacterium]|nr:NusG domain II-containing protein [Ignavibacteriales bacterium]
MNIKSRLKYEEYDLIGNHTGDIVFVREGNLFDFRNSEDSGAGLLKEIATKLQLPSNLKNPKLVKFIAVGEADNSDKTIKIFSNNSLVKEIKLKKELVNFSVEGVQGTSEFQISQNGIKAISAPCGHKTCLKLGTASIVGDSLVCIPNKLRAVVYGNGGGLLDAISF